MAYSPKINVFDERPIKENLLAYFRSNQSDALAWANGGNALPDIARFYKSPHELVTIFPALTILKTEHNSDFIDTLVINYVLTLELAIIHGNQSTLSDLAPKYSMAVESMLVNMPETTLCQNSIIQESNAVIGAITTTFNLQGKFKNQFIEVFQIQAGWQITTRAFG